MHHIQFAAEAVVRDLLKDVAARCMSSGEGADCSSSAAVLEAVDYMDDGSPICLKVTIDAALVNLLPPQLSPPAISPTLDSLF
jgi:5-oxoprolinase (ATP-hydrolysing)